MSDDTKDNMPAYVLVCTVCSRQRELPTLEEMIGPGRDGWLHCDCKGKSTKFSVRLRAPTVKTEPHP